MNIVIHVGHHGKGTGASFDGRDEVAIATIQAETVCSILYSEGHTVLFIPSKKERYRDIQKAVNSSVSPIWNLYIQFHVNSSKGISLENDHGIIFYDRRSSVGPIVAQDIAESLRDNLKYNCKAISDDSKGYERVHPCIESVRPVAILLEPHFIQVHRDEITVGKAIAAGILKWIG